MDCPKSIFVMRTSEHPHNLTIWCLCAEWCVICREFKTAFLNMQFEQPEHEWHWTDIEDHDEVLCDIDVQGFPSIVIWSSTDQWCFAGTIEPRTDTLLRLIRSSLAGELRLTESEANHWQALQQLR